MAVKTSWSSGDVLTAADLTDTFAAKADLESEPITDGSISSGTLTLNLNNGNVGYVSTAPTADFTLDVTNASTSNGFATTVTVLVTQDSTGYIPATLKIDGTSQTINWQGGSAPSPTDSAGAIDMFSFTLVRRSSAWEVFGSALVGF